MKKVSPEFYAQITKKRNFEYIVTVHFDEVGIDDVVLHNEDLMISGCEITNSSESSSFPLGNAIAKTLTLVLPNNTGRWDSYNFYGALIHVVLKNYTEVLDKDEYVDLGTYRVINPETPGSTVEITAVDNMYLADVKFESTSTDIKLSELFEEVCNYCHLYPETDESGNVICTNGDYIVKEIPTDATCRDMLGYIACISGGNAQILPKLSEVTTRDSYTVHINTYEFSKLGNIWDGDKLNDYTNPQILDGGDFTFSNEDETFDGGSYLDTEYYHMLSFGTSLTCSTDDVIVTGLKTVADDDTEIKSHPFEDAYVLVIENPLIKRNEQTALDLMAPILLGYPFRPFELEHISYPLADLGDICYVMDRKSRTYPSIITDITFRFKGATTFKCSAEAPLTANASYSSKSMLAVEQAKKDTEKQINNYDIAVQRMNELAVNSLGYYESFEDDEISGRISYIHNKPTLDTSVIAYKQTIDGFFLGKRNSTSDEWSWVSGFDSNGNAVLNILNAIGINADWINTGTLTVGGTGSNKDGSIEVYDKDNKNVGSWDKNGLFATSGKIGGINRYADRLDSFSTQSLTAVRVSPGCVSASRNIDESWGGIFYGHPNYAYPDCLILYNAGKSDNGMIVANASPNQGLNGITFTAQKYNTFQFWRDWNLQALVDEGGFQKLSDERKKNSIENIPLDKTKLFFKKVNPVTFKYNNAVDDSVINYGIIAQELEDALQTSDLSYNSIIGENDGYLYVNYQELHGLELAGIKDLYNIVEKQQEEINLLKDEINALKGDK